MVFNDQGISVILEKPICCGATLFWAKLVKREAAIFRTDDLVPASGIYSVFHAQHRLVKKVGLFKSELFPKCSRCSSPVLFALIRSLPALDYVNDLAVRIPLLELVPLEEEPSVAA
jgi:hypothetical protein